MLNISSRKFRITVGGLDVTSLVQYFEVGDDRVSSSGLISTKGSIKLRYNPKFNIGRNPKISLDPKIPSTAPYWSRGKPVKLWLDDSTLTERKHPRHSLRILTTTFDRNELSLTIEVGCLLALLDSQQPEGDESETCLNQRRSVDDVVRSLLNGGARDYPGVSIVYLGFIPGLIESPQEKGSGGSYVGEAGSVAYGRGYALWVTKDEEIKAIRILPKDSLARIVLDADNDSVNYTRNDAEGSSGETPYDRVRVSYSVVTLTETETEYTQTTEEFGATEFTNPNDQNVLIRKTQITDRIDFQQSKRFVNTLRWMRISEVMPWLFDETFTAEDVLKLVETVSETFYFESSFKENQNLNEACKDEGINGVQGRLLKKYVEIKRLKGWIYSEWIEQRPSFYKFWSAFEFDTYSTEWTYYTFLNNASEGETSIKKIETVSRIHLAVIYPKAWWQDVRMPMGLVNAGGIVETWQRRFGTNEWAHRTTERRPLGLAFRAICDAKLKKVKVERTEDELEPVQSVHTEAIREFAQQITAVRDEITVSSTQTTPPSPEFIPERYSRTEETVIEEFPIVSAYATGGTGKIKEITLDTPVERKANGTYQSPINPVDPLGSVGLRGLNDDLEQARVTAETEALLVWGRFRSVNMTYDLYDIWFDLPQLPLVRFDVYDRDRITEETYKHSYIVDGWTNAVTLRECICSHDGLWLGTSLSVEPKTILIAASIPPNSTYISVAPLPYALQEGDPIVIDKQQSINTQTSVQGGVVLGLSTPLGLAITAGKTILVGGFVYTVATNTSVGATSLILTTPLRAPVTTGQTGTVGTITTATAYVPQGSTAIPVTTTTNTTTLTPPSVTIDVEAIVPPASLPLVFDSKVVLRSAVSQIDLIPSASFDSRIVVRFPAGIYENIGSANFNAQAKLTSEFTQKLNFNFDARIALRSNIQITADFETPIVLRSDIRASFLTSFESQVNLISEFEQGLVTSTFDTQINLGSDFTETPSFESGIVLGVDITTPLTFESGIVLGVDITSPELFNTQINLGSDFTETPSFDSQIKLGVDMTGTKSSLNSFEIIAVW